jgi:tRNA pseudouridine38-40 synthase
LRCLVEYDGTDYFGWQLQAGWPTIQDEIERAIMAVTGVATRVTGAGRTDRGVHALGQVAHFDTESHLHEAELERALNAHLPSAVALKQMRGAPPGFHARFSALSRTYRYTIVNQAVRSPLRTRFACHVRARLRSEQMAEAMEFMLGEHDFGAFGSSPGDPPSHGGKRSTVRRVTCATVESQGEDVRLRITANAFLTHMARAIVALVIDVGLGVADVATVRRMLERQDDRRRGRLAPPQGLCLVGVDYGEAERELWPA